MNWENQEISCLTGKILKRIGIEGQQIVEIITSENEKFTFFHEQDCCEFVRVFDTQGDVSNILHTPLLKVSKEETREKPEFIKVDDTYGQEDSTLWTIFTFETEKGKFVFIWLGESNGYYSESVTFKKDD